MCDSLIYLLVGVALVLGGGCRGRDEQSNDADLLPDSHLDGDLDTGVDGDLDADSDEDLDVDETPEADTTGDADGYDEIDADADESPIEEPPGWVWTPGGSSLDHGNAVALTPEGSVIVGGTYSDTVDFDPGVGEEERTSVVQRDAFVARLTPELQLEWVRTWGSEVFDEVDGVAVSPDGSIVVVGRFGGTIDFDHGPAVAERTSEGGLDVFVAKLSAEGDLEWVVSFGSTAGDYPTDVAVSSDGSIVVSGTFLWTVDFDPGPGVEELTSDSVDGFIVKLSPEGEYEWAHVFGGSLYDYANSVAVGPDDSCVLGGGFTGSVDFDPGSGVEELRSEGQDSFVVVFEEDGSFRWAVSFGGRFDDSVEDLAIHESGSIVAVGSFNETADFDPGPGVEEIETVGVGDAFVLALSSAGDLEWVRPIGSRWEDSGASVAVASDASVAVVGYYTTEVDLDPDIPGDELPSGWDINGFLVRLEADGSFRWAHGFGQRSWVSFSSVALGEHDTIAVAGTYSDTTDFDPGPGVDERSPVGQADVVVLRLLSEGFFDR